MNPSPQPQQISAPPSEDFLSNGPAGAAILSAAIGCCALGILAVIADASKPVSQFFTFYLPTGPLSGVTTTAILLWLATWFILAHIWHHKTVAMAKVNAAAFLLLFFGVLLTFPPFADLLLRK